MIVLFNRMILYLQFSYTNNTSCHGSTINLYDMANSKQIIGLHHFIVISTICTQTNCRICCVPLLGSASMVLNKSMASQSRKMRVEEVGIKWVIAGPSLTESVSTLMLAVTSNFPPSILGSRPIDMCPQWPTMVEAELDNPDVLRSQWVSMNELQIYDSTLFTSTDACSCS